MTDSSATPTAAAPAHASPDVSRLRRLTGQLLQGEQPYMLYVAFAILLVVFSLASPYFLSLDNFLNIGRQTALVSIIAVGMTFVIISGGIDLSIGSVIAFTGVFLAVILRDTSIHPLVAFVLVLIITTVFGGLMGAVIHYLKMPPFIVTLAGMFLARGMSYVLSIDSIPIEHEYYGTLTSLYYRLPGGGRLTRIGGIMLVVFVAGIIIAHRTRFGTNVYALGGGVQTAELMGVPVARTTIQIYALSGFLAGLSGIVFLSIRPPDIR
jgi:simple sugar transport system permease protein